MRFFALLDFQYAMLLILAGLISLVVLYVAFLGYDLVPGKRAKEGEAEEYPDGIRAQDGPVPLLLILIYAGLAVWAVAYVVVFGILGNPF